jgi:chemotaxis protein methyltransferase CheR
VSGRAVASVAERPAREWADFTRQIKRRTGLDLGAYKPEQMQRRLRWLMLRANVSTCDEYVGLLDRQPARLRELRDYVTINVSEFFRSPRQFDHLRDDILPALLARRPRLRVWSAGCSYGAETYSLALLLEDMAPGVGHYIVGTDVDDTMLARARAASAFTEQDLRNLPAALRRQFRQGEDGGLALSSTIASRVIFKRHDLLCDPAEPGFDLILCRNVMMYFTAEAKARVFKSLYDALGPGGYLFVGSSEALAEPADVGFTHEQLAFYRKQESA